jgi:hypothetical protein
MATMDDGWMGRATWHLAFPLCSHTCIIPLSACLPVVATARALVMTAGHHEIQEGSHKVKKNNTKNMKLKKLSANERQTRPTHAPFLLVVGGGAVRV